MALVPGEVSLLQTYSVNKLLELENFSYDLIFPMDLRKLIKMRITQIEKEIMLPFSPSSH